MTIIYLLIVLIALLVLYIRLAPSDVRIWHDTVSFGADEDLPGSVIRTIPGGEDRLQRLIDIVESTPRTTKLAGSLEEKRLTYVTRSKTIGFPDYTTIGLTDDTQIAIYGRLRFGRHDFDVNRTRVEGWIAALEH